MISFDKKFIFVHIYKTAGTSLRAALYPFTGGLTLNQMRVNKYSRKFLKKEFFPELHPQLWKHAGANEYKVYLGESYSDFFSFAFVRNPFDWQVSLYEYIRKSKGHHLNRMACQVDFKDFLKSRVSETLRPQKDFIYDEHGNSIVSYIGKFEEINKGFNAVCEQIGISAELPYLNQSRRKNLDFYYDKEARDIVLRNFEIDFDIFDYSDHI